MPSQCPSCGDQNFTPGKQCVCGYHDDETFEVDSLIPESEGTGNKGRKGKEVRNLVKTKENKTAEESKENKPAEEIVLKEIDSWNFSFSQPDNCIYLGTPALQTFRLKLTLDDLVELTELMYQKTGEEKTTRKLRLSIEEIPELIDKVHRMIQDKRAKIAIKFTSDELREIKEFINVKLKT